MQTATRVKPAPSTRSSRPAGAGGGRLLGMDLWMLALVFVMIAFGLVMVYSASWDVSFRLHGDASALFRRQLGNLAIGLLAMALTAWMPIRWLRWLAVPILGVSMLALLLVLLVNSGDGPRRAILGGSIQPSEMAKLAVIIYLAVWMESKGNRLSEWGYGFIPLLMLVAVVDSLILLQPDLSAVLTVAIVALVMFFLAGARISQALFISVGGAFVGYLLVRITNTGRARWADYMSGLIDIKQASYHVQHALQAFYAGGILGRGLGASREKFGLLPAPHTDSIYAVIGEELGLIGALFVLVLFWLFLWRGFKVAMDAPDRLTMLLVSGVTVWIAVEALVNMSVLLGLLPFAGNALPFFSYGGSSLVVTLTGTGFILNAARRKRVEVQAKTYVSPVGIGWRNRRRRVSRLGHNRRRKSVV